MTEQTNDILYLLFTINYMGAMYNTRRVMRDQTLDAYPANGLVNCYDTISGS